MKSQKIVSIISDAGTPTVSDPGKIIINECLKNNYNVYPVPGASAVTAAISISGFSEKYYFYGFFPEKEKILNEDFEKLSNLNSSLVFFIPANKFNKSISVLKNFFSDRKILICREITKFYEEYLRYDVNDLKVIDKKLKGELTIVLSEKNFQNKTSNYLDESDKKSIKKLINILSIKDIVSLMSKNTKISKKEIYNYCLKVKNEK